MNSYVYNLDENKVNILKKHYKEYIVDSSNPYALFEIVKGIRITCYTTYKVVLSGGYVDNFVNEIDELLNIETSYAAIGSDEVGTGDVFGPVVVCSTYLTKENVENLRRMNITDSKKLSDDQIRKIVPQFYNKIIYSLMILGNEKYNLFQENGYNMNKLKAMLHNGAISAVYKKAGCPNVPVILDQFCEPHLYFEYLKNEKNVFKDITFKTKAEDYHVAVAAASMIARYAFLKKMDELSNMVGVTLIKGAGSIVDEQLRKLSLTNDKNDFRKFAKLNFKNFMKIGE